MSKYRLLRVVFEDSEGNEITVEADYDSVEVTVESGIERIVTAVGVEHRGSGEKRMLLKAWSGCRSFEKFVPVRDL